MCEFDNNISKNSDYISKSKINRKVLREMHIPDCVTVKSAKKDFNSCEGKTCKVGSPYDKSRQRRTKFVSKYELYHEIIKGRSSRKK